MHLYPKEALSNIEFHKIQQLLINLCELEASKTLAGKLRASQVKKQVEFWLNQSQEYKSILDSNDFVPWQFIDSLEKELKILSIENSVLQAEEIQKIKKVTIDIRSKLQWFRGKEDLYPHLYHLLKDTTYERNIVDSIHPIIDENNQIKDGASRALASIRTELEQTRTQSRKLFDQIIRQYAKAGYLADITENFLNGRRTIGIQAEYKRIAKGIIHGASESQKTVFIEPERLIPIQNKIYELEIDERREEYKILQDLTSTLAPYGDIIHHYYHRVIVFDFIRAKALLARKLNAQLPHITPHPTITLLDAYHPVLWLQNKQKQQKTVPISLRLDRKERILIISGPNAGGKTVSMKTVALLQYMLQCGLLVPCSDRSEMGIFKQMMVHIGDTQSIENELSTYSAHLTDMKYFLEFATGSTLFFIDELGSGSDPLLGGAFAESMVEHLTRKHALGIITTHYLNLKVMAGKIPGIINGAMTFDEKKLEPLYHLQIGKPGSSYTFEIAQRVGLPKDIIQRAKTLAQSEHIELDALLHQSEKQQLTLEKKQKQLNELIKYHEAQIVEYNELIDKEKHEQQLAYLRLQNKIKKEELDYLKDMERKFKQIINDWKKAENKKEVIEAAEQILFKRKHITANQNMARKADRNYRLVAKSPEVGDLVRNEKNHQVGTLIELDQQKAIVQIGRMPFHVNIKEWVVVARKNRRNKK
ncbi:MAG TPA: DNA mismatch repair protein MutS [Chitinophagaceae bacterium]|nr:DNA mismatch repair protein MutS [Chitinophagaceae bacterium]